MTEDLYRTLHVDPNADVAAIHAAYRRLARLYHPDLNPTPEAAERMRAINAAYKVLSDPGRRAVYDARRFLRPTSRVTVAAPPRPGPVVVTSVADAPTPLQRRVDRVVAVVGVIVLIAIAFYAVSVLPYAERQFQDEVRGFPLERPSSALLPDARSGPSEHTAASSVPDRLRSDHALREFPGTVLVAPSNLEPFASLPVVRLDEASRGIARYAIYYGDLTSGGATISGVLGRDSFDTATPRLPDCAPDASYCSGSAPGQLPSGSPGLELFRAPGLVDDYPAFAIHRVCCNGVFWSIYWYEPRANMSYEIDLSRVVALRFGSPSAEADAAAAHAVGSLARQLVRLP